MEQPHDGGARDRTHPATDPAMPFGALLRRLRVLAGLTQEQLAERAGLSARAVGDLERDGARRRSTDWATQRFTRPTSSGQRPCIVKAWPYGATWGTAGA
ncbi:MAG TPA: helix-turn-helix domain-containing protein [Chloroflexota bacterium]|nr:helix-turn-helix domain-containing protein [Chloroflexota bacterium]